MAERTHYETLGLKRGATATEVKTAYRAMVRRHHPDVSSDPASPRIFQAATLAYETLSDRDARRLYDQGLELAERRAAERREEERRQREAQARVATARPAGGNTTRRTVADEPEPVAAPRPARTMNVATEVAKLSAMFSRGQVADADRLAREILHHDSRQPLPYAVLGDIARGRGHLDEAARMYSLALQMDPKNALYLRRYEDLLDRAQVTADAKGRPRIEPHERRTFAFMALAVIDLIACLYVATSPERSMLKGLPPVSSWTLGLMVMLFLCGVAAGACLALGNLLDRLDSMTSGRVGPTVTLGLVAVVSFPAACVLYALVGLVQRGFNYSTTRLIAAVAGSTAALALAAIGSPAGIQPMQVLLWGGNLGYIGALCGWMVADSFR